MNFKFITIKNKFGHKKIVPENNVPKSSHMVEKLTTVAATILVETERVRAIVEEHKNTKGWVTVEKGTWHDDESSDLIVNGRHGFYTYEYIELFKDNVLNNGGRDFLHNQGYTNTTAVSRGAGFLGVSENAAGADATHTTLAGEITTNGLGRADADTKTHTTGTNVTTIQHTFTASGSFSAIQLCGLFTAATGGTMVNENTITPVALAANDTLRITWTVTMG